MGQVGFVGLGDMGGAIAQRIIDAGFSTALWARRIESLNPYSGSNVRHARTLVELGQSSEVVGVCVFGDADVRAVVLGDDGILSGMSAGKVLVIHSTISVETTNEIAHAANARGIDVLDAPVSGARSGAVDGKLAIMVGGTPAAFSRAKPVMDAYGGTILHLGPIGSGQKMKVLNNVLCFANLRLGHLALEIGEQLGLAPEAVKTTLRSGSAGSFSLNILIDRLLPDPGFCRHAVTMNEKDTRLFQRVCKASGIDRTVLEQVAEESIEMVGKLGQRQEA